MNTNHVRGSVTIEISPGELVDRLTILAIKGKRIDNIEQSRNVRLERDALEEVRRRAIPASTTLLDMEAQLAAVNEALWVREDEIRTLERREDFGIYFVSVARSIYRLNDQRARLKRKINELLQSTLIEEKIVRRLWPSDNIV